MKKTPLSHIHSWFFVVAVGFVMGKTGRKTTTTRRIDAEIYRDNNNNNNNNFAFSFFLTCKYFFQKTYGKDR